MWHHTCRRIRHKKILENVTNRVASVITTRQSSSESSAYAGDGKTTIRVLNQEESHLNLVNTYSAQGFRLSNNLFINGSILLFPTNVFCWNVRRGKDITVDSLLIFDLIVPKTKIVIIGYGQQGEPYDASIPFKLKKKGISCEMLTTPNAVTTYNFLVHDSVHVAGAFVPMKDDVYIESRDAIAMQQHDVIYKERDFFPEQNIEDRSQLRDQWDLRQKVNKGKDKYKQRFDED